MHDMKSPLNIELQEKTLIVRFPDEWQILSWAPFNGGDMKSSCIFNHQCDSFKNSKLDPIFNGIVERYHLPKNSVGMLTGADVGNYRKTFLSKGPVWVHAVATLGLQNARSAGDEADVENGEVKNHSGTINLMVVTNALPHLTGRVEGHHIASMAKTQALLESGEKSKKSGRPATGTGTDCIVVASCGEVKENYCGMHTVPGELIGKTVFKTISNF